MKNAEIDNSTIRAWVIRAGIRGNAEDYFLRKNRIVLIEPGFGDLSKIEPNRQSFYGVYRSLRPDETPSGISGVGGKFFRFVHEIKTGDIILYPSLTDKQVHVGQLMGEYQFVKSEIDFPHQREVAWIGSFPKDSLSRAAQYELGAARTLYRYQKHLDEIIQRIRKFNQGEHAEVPST